MVHQTWLDYSSHHPLPQGLVGSSATCRRPQLPHPCCRAEAVNGCFLHSPQGCLLHHGSESLCFFATRIPLWLLLAPVWGSSSTGHLESQLERADASSLQHSAPPLCFQMFSLRRQCKGEADCICSRDTRHFVAGTLALKKGKL